MVTLLSHAVEIYFVFLFIIIHLLRLVTTNVYACFFSVAQNIYPLYLSISCVYFSNTEVYNMYFKNVFEWLNNTYAVTVGSILRFHVAYCCLPRLQMD